MKYCNTCKVYINKNLDRCPLCGSHTDEKSADSNQYEANIEPYVNYPDIKLKGDAYHNFLRKKSLLLSFAIIFICVFINILESPNSFWSAYVAVSVIFAYLGIFRPIYNKTRFYFLLIVYSFLLSIGSVLIDIIISYANNNNLSDFGESIFYIFPSIILLLLIVTDIMLFSDKSKNKYYLISILIETPIALVPQIIIWTDIIEKESIEWLSFSVFTFAVLNLLLILIIYWKKLKEEIQRKFFI